MAVSTQEIKAWLDAGGSPPTSSEVIETGHLLTEHGDQVEYALHFGWDLAIANRCDDSWGAFNIRLLRHIADLKLHTDELAAALEGVQLDDGHWKWLQKSLVYRSNQYKWFFIMAESYPQAACLIFHPKPSAIDATPIFYVEYVAVAPWNRVNPIAERSFRGLGAKIIGVASHYAIHVLGLRPGYSLHALPKAIPFYEAIGMVHFEAHDKDGLPFFEMPEDKCVPVHERAA